MSNVISLSPVEYAKAFAKETAAYREARMSARMEALGRDPISGQTAQREALQTARQVHDDRLAQIEAGRALWLLNNTDVEISPK